MAFVSSERFRTMCASARSLFYGSPQARPVSLFLFFVIHLA